MRLPTWDELIEKQRQILEHPLDDPLFVAGPPGSGKTVLAVRRARMATDDGRSVALVTFNRMLRRLAMLLDQDAGHVRTMHSFVWRDYVRRTGGDPEPSPSGSYDYDWAAMLRKLANHPKSGPTWRHLIVDEGQDLPEGFFQYAHRHVSGALTVFADDDQALSARRTTLEQIKSAADLPDPIILQENHRNCPEVAIVAEHFHSGRLPAAEVRRTAIAERPRLIRSVSLIETAKLITRWVQTRGGSIGVVVDWNNTAEAVCQRLRSELPDRRIDIYDHARKNEDSIDLLSPGVTVLNKESVKGQEFDAVFVLELEHFVPCRDDIMLRVMYMLCTRARDHLFLVYGPNELSAQAMAALPDTSVLERS
jgi:superfamily I DNA/RNA helicase